MCIPPLYSGNDDGDSGDTDDGDEKESPSENEIESTKPAAIHAAINIFYLYSYSAECMDVVCFVSPLLVGSFNTHRALSTVLFNVSASEMARASAAESCFAWWRSKLRFVSICKHLVSCYMYSVPEVTSNDTRAHSKHTHFAN